MKVSVFIASRKRPQMLLDMLRSLHETTTLTPVDIEVVAAIDDDDISKLMFQGFGKYLDYNLDYSPVKRGALAAWNRAFQISTGDLLVPAGDDQVFHEGWLDYALESHRTRVEGYGVVGLNDLAYNGNTQVATMWIFDRAYCKEVMGGIFAPPCYHYYCIDSEWNEKAKMLNRFYWDERSIVEHLHSAHGKRPVDELDLEKQNAGWMEEDNRTFEQRKVQGFPVTWEPII